MEEAPIDLMPSDTEQRAYDAGERAMQNPVIQNAVSAILLYTWLIKASRTPQNTARLQNNLGIAYRNLPTGDRGDNLRHAISCYEQALEVFTSMHVDHYAQVVKRNLEIVRQELRDLEQG